MRNNPGTSRAAAPVTTATSTLREIITVTRLYPQLWLHVQAHPDGVHLTATLVPAWGEHQASNVPLVKAVWQPSEVTEQLVVEWAYRALRRLLQDRYEGTGHL